MRSKGIVIPHHDTTEESGMTIILDEKLWVLSGFSYFGIPNVSRYDAMMPYILSIKNDHSASSDVSCGMRVIYLMEYACTDCNMHVQ